MSYRVRFTTQTGATFYWERTFATRTGATHSAQLQADSTGYTFAVEEVPEAPEPTSATEQLVSLFRDLHGGQQTVPNEADGVEYVPGVKPEPTNTTERLVGLIRDRHAKGLAKYGTTLDRADLSPEDWAQHAIEEALDLAGYLMRVKDGFAPEPGSTAARHVEILRGRVKELEEELATVTANLAKAPSASEAPGEGGDTDRKRLEALERFLEGEQSASIAWWQGEFSAVHVSDGVEITAPTLTALADKLAEMEGKG